MQIVDHEQPFHSVATDCANLILVLARDSVPAVLLAMELHRLVFRRGSGAARLITSALQSLLQRVGDEVGVCGPRSRP